MAGPGKRVRMPGNNEAREANIIGAPRQIRVDTTRQDLRLHDGVTPGGVRIPNIDAIVELISSGAEGSVGITRLLPDQDSLVALQPNANTIAVVRGIDGEDIYIWRTGTPDQGDIISGVDGFWHRLDSQTGTAVRMWRAGMIHLQVGGVTPATGQATMLWIDDGVLKAWDGAAYLPSTPTLFTKYLASEGTYFTGGAGVPDRIKDFSVIAADFDTVKESGWFRTDATSAHVPVVGNNFVYVGMLGSNDGFQKLIVQGTGGDGYIRFLVGGVWGAWTSTFDKIPVRLEATQLQMTADCNTITSTGFYSMASASSSKPINFSNFLLQVIAMSGFVVQLAYGDSSRLPVAKRIFASSTWTTWRRANQEPGEYVDTADNAAPWGTLLCDGSAISRNTYSALFSRIGTVYGVGDGATTFNLPDRRGVVNRGLDLAKGYDTGRQLGSYQADSIKAHAHTGNTASGGAHGHTGTANGAGTHSHSGSTYGAGAHAHQNYIANNLGGNPAYPPPGDGGGPVVGGSNVGVGDHTHALAIDAVGNHTHPLTVDAVGGHGHSFTTDNFGGTETVMKNISVYPCIVY